MMSVPKVAGIETEYGILIRGAAKSDPFKASRLLLRQYMDLEVASPSENDEEQAATGELEEVVDELYSVMLPNGARFYIDHAHPEYSTAEAVTPLRVVAADKAGEVIVERCCRRVNASGDLADGEEIAIYKNNSDQKGRSYGCHENYSLAAATFQDLIERKLHRTLQVLVPFLVTRTLFCGAGKVGSENGLPPASFQLSQRADFFETVIGLQTTYHRPLINTRDEPHADSSNFRRLHVILGDANMAEYSTYLKVGTTQLILMMLEDNQVTLNLALEDPINAAQVVARDLSFGETLCLVDGDKVSALTIQYQYLHAAQQYLAGRSDLPHLYEVAQVWEDTLDKLAKNWRLLSTRLDWAIKRNLLERYLQNQRCDWETARAWQVPIELTLDYTRQMVGNDPAAILSLVRQRDPTRAAFLQQYSLEKALNWADYWKQREIYFGLRRLDLEYHDIRRSHAPGTGGVFYRLQAQGAVDRLLRDEDIEYLAHSPPDDTRAFLRGFCLAHFADHVRRADWGELTFWDPIEGQARVLLLPDPSAGNKAQFGHMLERSPTLQHFFMLQQRERSARAAIRTNT